MTNFSKVWQCLFAWNVPPASTKELASTQVVVTHAVDCEQDWSAGPGNTILADMARNMARWRSGGRGDTLPIVPQHEVLAADETLPHFGIAGLGEGGYLRDHPATTDVVCRDQAEVCYEHEWRRVLVVTFPDHMWRACATYRKLGLIPVPAPMPSHKTARYYSRNARRWYMRRRWTFRMYERLARLYFLWKGHI